MPSLNQPDRYTATMILDSVSSNDHRLSTIHVTMPRIILAEANTHRAFTRNARSTRAVPTTRLIEEVSNNPYCPLRWLKNKPGMQASEEMDARDRLVAEREWDDAARCAVDAAHHLFALGLHKQWAGRLLEPFLFVDWLVSSTSWSNFMALRDHDDAQPEMQLVAQRIRDCLDASTPTLRKPGEWHLPYIREEDRAEVIGSVSDRLGVSEPVRDGFLTAPLSSVINDVLCKISAARCARVSYTPFDGSASIDAELVRFDRLASSRPVHASPMEHQATPDVVSQGRWVRSEEHRNFQGWRQFRATISNETIEEMPTPASRRIHRDEDRS